MYIHLETHCAVMLSNKKYGKCSILIQHDNYIRGYYLDSWFSTNISVYIFIEGESMSRENTCGDLKWKLMDHCIFYGTEMHMHDTCTRVKKKRFLPLKKSKVCILSHKYILLGGVSGKFRVHQLSNKIVNCIKCELLHFVRSTCGRVLPWTLKKL